MESLFVSVIYIMFFNIVWFTAKFERDREVIGRYTFNFELVPVLEQSKDGVWRPKGSKFGDGRHIDTKQKFQTKVDVTSGTKSGFKNGYVNTANGIVRVYSWDEFNKSQFELMVGGMLYEREIGRPYSRRGLATKAHEFAWDVKEERETYI